MSKSQTSVFLGALTILVSIVYLEQFLQLVLYFHSICTNEVAQGKRKQINQKQSHHTILKFFFRTQFNYDANRLPSSSWPVSSDHCLVQ